MSYKRTMNSNHAWRKNDSRRDYNSSAPDETILFGFHPVIEALRNPRRKHKKLLATLNGVNKLEEHHIALNIKPEIVRPQDIAKLLPADAVHQGLYLVSEPLPTFSLDKAPENGVIIALDQITDPHNVGAIIRTAAAFNVDGILCTFRHSPATTGTLAKSASGGLEHVNFITITNLANGLIELQKRGYEIIGLDSEGTQDLNHIELKRPIALVFGAEGKGLRQRTRELCSTIARLDMPGQIKSLNVSNAAAIALNAVHQSSLKAH